MANKSTDEKAQKAATEAPAEALVGVDDFLLQLEAAETLKAGFRRLVHIAGYDDSTRTFADWETYFESFRNEPVH